MDEEDIGGVIADLLPRDLGPRAVGAGVGSHEGHAVVGEHPGDAEVLRGVDDVGIEVREEHREPVLVGGDVADALACRIEVAALFGDLRGVGVRTDRLGDGGVLAEHVVGRLVLELDRDEWDERGDLLPELVIPPGPAVAGLVAVGDDDVGPCRGQRLGVELHVGADDLDACGVERLPRGLVLPESEDRDGCDAVGRERGRGVEVHRDALSRSVEGDGEAVVAGGRVREVLRGGLSGPGLGCLGGAGDEGERSESGESQELTSAHDDLSRGNGNEITVASLWRG